MKEKKQPATKTPLQSPTLKARQFTISEEYQIKQSQNLGTYVLQDIRNNKRIRTPPQKKTNRNTKYQFLTKGLHHL